MVRDIKLGCSSAIALSCLVWRAEMVLAVAGLLVGAVSRAREGWVGEGLGKTELTRRRAQRLLASIHAIFVNEVTALRKFRGAAEVLRSESDRSLREQGEPSGVNRIYRLYREEGLTVRKRKGRRRAIGSCTPIRSLRAGRRHVQPMVMPGAATVTQGVAVPGEYHATNPGPLPRKHSHRATV